MAEEPMEGEEGEDGEEGKVGGGEGEEGKKAGGGAPEKAVADEGRENQQDAGGNDRQATGEGHGGRPVEKGFAGQEDGSEGQGGTHGNKVGRRAASERSQSRACKSKGAQASQMGPPMAAARSTAEQAQARDGRPRPPPLRKRRTVSRTREISEASQTAIAGRKAKRKGCGRDTGGWDVRDKSRINLKVLWRHPQRPFAFGHLKNSCLRCFLRGSSMHFRLVRKM